MLTEERLQEIRARLEAVQNWADGKASIEALVDFESQAIQDVTDLLAEVKRLRAEYAHVSDLLEGFVNEAKERSYYSEVERSISTEERQRRSAKARAAYYAELFDGEGW